MPDLVSQINEMIDILEAIDPRAATQFRGRATAQVIAQAAPAPPPPPPPMTRMETTIVAKRPSLLTQGTPKIPIFRDLTVTADSLVQGIILAEVLGKPLSRRKRNRI